VVADAHLGQVPQATEAAFHAFLDRVPQPGDHLLINGDLFDFWFEYGAVVPRKHFASVARLQQTRARGVTITFIGGNHDRWGGDFLRHDLGIAFYAGETELEVAGRRAYVAHGDGLTEQHWSGALLHRVTRHPLTIWVFRKLHPDVGFWIAAKLSGKRRRELGLVVLAHTHRPCVERLPDGRAYLNPGAWLDGYRYAVVTPDAIELKTFSP